MALNIVNVATITGKIAGGAVTTGSGITLIAAVATDNVAKVNALYVSNVDGTNPAAINVVVNDGSTDYHIAKTITVPADSTLDVLSKSIYLEPTWSLKVIASADSDLEAVASWENMA